MDFTLEELRQYIIELSHKPLSSMVEYQINKLCQEGFSYREIARCLQYFYEIQGNDISSMDKYGIGIVRNIRTEANNNYNRAIQKQEEQRNAAMRAQEKPPEMVTYKPPRRTFVRKEIDINGIK